MLDRHLCPNGVTIYRSRLLRDAGIPHAFSTRIGGVSSGPFESMNLGNPNGCPVQDTADNIAENYRRLHHAIGCDNRRRVLAHQVHGACVLNPATSPQTDSIHGGTEIGQGDALVTNDASLLLSVRTADCVPVLLADRSGRRVAAIHAGWRGVIAGAVIEALKQFANPQNLLAAIGPCIGYDAFEVGMEVVEIFDKSFHDEALTRRLPDGKGRVDLKQAIRLQLTRHGVIDDRIDTTDRCTYTHADEFFSHRREHGITGRLAAVIGATA